MTDVPAWSASMVSLWGAGRALEATGGARFRWGAATLLAGVAGLVHEQRPRRRHRRPGRSS